MHNLMVSVRHFLTFGATGTTQSSKVDNEGCVSDIVFTLPNFTNVVTGTLSILDEDGNTIWTDPGGARAKNAVYVISGIRVPVSYGFTIRVTLSGNAGGAGGQAKVRTFIGNS